MFVTSLAFPACATISGPDSFGYTADDGARFSFEDISSTGFRRDLGTNGAAILSSDSGWIPISFSFNFYGVTYSEVVIGVNGYISFLSTTNDTNVNLTTTATSPDVPIINVLADRWKFYLEGGGDAIYHETRGVPGDYRLIVQWNKAFSSLPVTNTVTFQAILYQRTGNILLQYLDTDSGDAHSLGQLASVGIRDTLGNTTGNALQYSYHQPAIQSGDAILFASPVPEPSSAVLILSGVLICLRRREINR